MKNEHEIENLIEEKSKELKRHEVPTDLWYSIEREIDKIPSKKQNIFAQIYQALWGNRLNLGYALIVCFIISISYFIYNIKKGNPIIQDLSITEKISQKSDVVAPIIKTTVKNENPKIIKNKLTKEKRINTLEKQAEIKIEKVDDYTKTVYRSKIEDLDASISECKKIYATDFNKIIKKNLSMVYDEKIKLLLDILKLD
jgi:hypothetical protein